MTLREAKKLRAGDTFKRPSANTHDAGFRAYTVIERNPTFITVQDEHGYVSRTHWEYRSTVKHLFEFAIKG